MRRPRSSGSGTSSRAHCRPSPLGENFMRYVIAMVGAIVAALLVTVFLSPQVANAVVARYTFESPDEVADLHAAVYMACNVAALAVGWAIGWFAGGRFASPPPPPA